ncbi:MAG TPA: serine/threonine-protein kinase [Pseudomonadota bacterium]|nr:serine/threonine-protein kinase [Pseudomonadota bacterium]
MENQKIGAYSIVRMLGAGGMGQVYEGVHDQIGRRAAIKVLHRRYANNKQIVQRFINEARAVNIVQHQSLVNIYEFGQTTDGSAYIVMEYLNGDTLRQRLERSGGRLAPDVAVRLCRQMASALAAAHSKGIIHRDLKPVNIMIVADAEAAGGERAKILDFGLAKVVQPDTADGGGLTGTGTILGTPAYMAPEQCRSARDVDDKSDVYSLGIILYEMLSSDIPFDAETDAELLSMHMYQEPPSLQAKVPQIHPELAALVHRMLAKQQAERPSAAEVATELARIPALAGAVAAVAGSINSGKNPSEAQSPTASPAKEPEPAAPTPSAPATSSAPRAATPATPPARRGLLFFGLVVVLLAAAAGGAVGWLGALRQGPTSASASADAGSAPKVTSTVHWSLTSIPAGAEVRGPLPSDTLIGQTPLMIEYARSTGTVSVMVRAPGHLESRVELSLARDEIASVTLRALPQSVPATDEAPGVASEDGGPAPALDAAPAPTAAPGDPSEKIGVQGSAPSPAAPSK